MISCASTVSLLPASVCVQLGLGIGWAVSESLIHRNKKRKMHQEERKRVREQKKEKKRRRPAGRL